jgi:hypothetical protein
VETVFDIVRPGEEPGQRRTPSGNASAPTREQRPMAAELKFLVPAALGDAVRDWAREHLQPDPHGGGVHRDAYSTTTLYTDTAEWDAYERRGSYARSKFRVRRYGEADVAFLERKLRTNALLSKRRQQVRLAELSRLEQPPTESSGWPGGWFAARLALRRLAPVCQVVYERVARVAPTLHGPARLTVDTGLRACPNSAWRFIDDVHVPFLEDRQIIEMKFLVAMPAVFKRALAEFNLVSAQISKYRLAVEALGLTALVATLESM